MSDLYDRFHLLDLNMQDNCHTKTCNSIELTCQVCIVFVCIGTVTQMDATARREIILRRGLLESDFKMGRDKNLHLRRGFIKTRSHSITFCQPVFLLLCRCSRRALK